MANAKLATFGLICIVPNALHTLDIRSSLAKCAKWSVPMSPIFSGIWFDNMVEFNGNVAIIDAAFVSWWNEFIELKPLSSSAELATDFMRSFAISMASISFVRLRLCCWVAIAFIDRLLALATAMPLFVMMVVALHVVDFIIFWLHRLWSSSISGRIGDELDGIEPSLVLLLWSELWLSRVRSLRCRVDIVAYVCTPFVFTSPIEFDENAAGFVSPIAASCSVSRFWAVLYKRNASWDNFSASLSFSCFGGVRFGNRRLLKTCQRVIQKPCKWKCSKRYCCFNSPCKVRIRFKWVYACTCWIGWRERFI